MANYESAKDSILRAEAALKLPNLVLAKQLAEKAENIARAAEQAGNSLSGSST